MAGCAAPLPPGPKGSYGDTWTTEGHEFTYDQTTIDKEVTRRSIKFMKNAHKKGTPFFVWVNPARMHIYTHLSKDYLDQINQENGWSIQEAGMTEFDDMVGALMDALDEMGIAKNTIIVVTSDNGPEVFTWPDGGATPFKGNKMLTTEGGFRSPTLVRWPAGIKKRGQVLNGIVSGLDWFPTLLAAAGYKGDIAADLRAGKQINGKQYKVHLDGYNQLDYFTGSSDTSARKEILYFQGSKFGAVRYNDFKYIFLSNPGGAFGATGMLSIPRVVNLRLDPYERTIDWSDVPWAAKDFFFHEFWRFVLAQRVVGKFAETFIEFPPQQAPASFNMDQVKKHIQEMRKKAAAHIAG